MKQKGKYRNYIFTVSLYSTSNKTALLFEGTIWAEVRIWKNKWQLEDMSYSGAALQHVSDTCNMPQLTGMPHTGQQCRGLHFLLRHFVLSAWDACTQLIRLIFFWNISSSIRVHSLFVPKVIFHILLLKPGRVNEFNLKEVNTLSTCTEVYCLNIQSAQWQFSAKASLLISSWYFFQTLNPTYLIKLSKILLSQIPLKPPSQHSGFTSASTQHLSSHYCSHISKDKYRSETKLKPNSEWDDSPCVREDWTWSLHVQATWQNKQMAQGSVLYPVSPGRTSVLQVKSCLCKLLEKHFADIRFLFALCRGSCSELCLETAREHKSLCSKVNISKCSKMDILFSEVVSREGVLAAKRKLLVGSHIRVM